VREEARARIALQVLQAEGQVARHLAQHLQFFLADHAGIPRRQQQHGNGGAVDQQGQYHHRVHAGPCHQRHEFICRFGAGGVVAHEILAGGNHLVDDAGFHGRGSRDAGTQIRGQFAVKAAPGNRLYRSCARDLGGGDGSDIAAFGNGQPAGLAQQFVAVADAQHQAIDAAEHAQHAVEPRDLRLLPDLLRPGSGLVDGAPDRRHQPRHVLLQHIIDGACAQGLDGALLADGAGQEHEGNLRRLLLRDAQCRHAIELRQGEVGEDQVGGEILQGFDQRLFGFDAAPVTGDSRTFELVQGTFRIGLLVFHEEDADGFSLVLSHSPENLPRLGAGVADGPHTVLSDSEITRKKSVPITG
jgi:hypothetical protein